MNEAEDLESIKGPIAWMTRNRVAPNLVMLIFLIGGFIMALQVKQEIFPEFQLDIVQVSVEYPGASPAEVEQGIILAVEDEVRGIDGIKEVRSSAAEGSGSITVELLSGTNRDKALQDVKNAVDRIQSFPEDAERPLVQLIEARSKVVSLILYGDQEESVLRNLAEQVRDELLQLEGITIVDLVTGPPHEIAVEVPRATLRYYNLTLDRIAEIIRQNALELPAGVVEAPSGEVLLRTQERRDFATQYANIPIVSRPDGTTIRLGELATLKETFGGSDQEAFFNGQRAMRLDVYRIGTQTPTGISQQVNTFRNTLQSRLPQGVEVAAWDDFSILFRDRMSLLGRNAFLGLILVLALLGLFLDPRLAFWVTIGIPISIIGSFLFLPLSGATINMVSLFAFILTLGIIVDDAVVVGEIVHQKREQGMGYLASAIIGAREIATPVVFAVLTNMAAFTPLFFIPGATGKIFLQIPAVVTAVFFVSLIESLYILPSHLSHPRKKTGFWQRLAKRRSHFDKWLHHFIHQVYAPALRACLRYHYATLAGGVALLLISFGVIAGKHVPFSYLPRIDSDIVTAEATLAFGSPISDARLVARELVDAAQDLLSQQDGELAQGIYTQIGTPLFLGGPGIPEGRVSGSHLVSVQLSLVSADQRELSGQEVANLWRKRVGPMPGLETLTFDATIHAGGTFPIDIHLSHPDTETLESAAQELATYLETYAGVSDIDSGVSLGKPQLSLRIKPEARSLGITAEELAKQLRASFYGAEALRQQRERNEVKVLVRLPQGERETIFTLEDLIVRSPNGTEIPLSEAATVERGRAYTEIKRTDGRRTIAVTAEVNDNIANANEILTDLENGQLPGLMERYPGLSYSLEGQQREQREALSAMGTGFILAMLAIFALLAIPFQSYIQPLIVMLSIPFGIVGALIGHLLLGYELSIISMMGIIALSGVVVNDSLVMVVTTNRIRKQKGITATAALQEAAISRFRPILLTSLTTFFGLAPMIFETSMQARFLIPMAISLGFGILFATLIILVICPAAYLIVEDARQLATPEEWEY